MVEVTDAFGRRGCATVRSRSVLWQARRPFHPQRLTRDHARGHAQPGTPVAGPPARAAVAWHRDGCYYSERRNEIVFIGPELGRQQLRPLLGAALLDDEELSLSQASRRHLPDPLLGRPGRDLHTGG
ncbi:hypothetical protein ABZW03_11225 [Kitasatospora sp. NPDC004799]|uniref:hypothetical protein n=1 Tax=Kitasatospora sp. NPDC004799 TaxID=3154460 RepID=UPI0033A96A12